MAGTDRERVSALTISRNRLATKRAKSKPMCRVRTRKTLGDRRRSPGAGGGRWPFDSELPAGRRADGTARDRREQSSWLMMPTAEVQQAAKGIAESPR